METELITVVASYGVGGVLAAGIFTVYRKDMKELVEQWRGQTEILLGVVRANTEAMVALRLLVEETSRLIGRRRDDA